MIAAISTALAALAGLFSSDSSRAVQTDSSSLAKPPQVPADPNVQPAPAAGISRLATPAIPSNIEPALGSPTQPLNHPFNASDFVSTGLGCFVGLVITLVVSLIGLLVFGLVNNVNPASGRTVSIVFLFTCIGFVLSSLAFLRVTAPGVSIKGFGPFPSISINPNRSGKGIQNSRVIKFYLAVITCIIVYLVYITLIALISDFSIGLSILSFLIGLVFGPILAILVVNRASVL